MNKDIMHEEYKRIPKAVKLKPGDVITCANHEDLVRTIRDLAYEGYPCYQPEPFKVVIAKPPKMPEEGFVCTAYDPQSCEEQDCCECMDAVDGECNECTEDTDGDS